MLLAFEGSWVSTLGLWFFLVQWFTLLNEGGLRCCRRLEMEFDVKIENNKLIVEKWKLNEEKG